MSDWNNLLNVKNKNTLDEFISYTSMYVCMYVSLRFFLVLEFSHEIK